MKLLLSASLLLMVMSAGLSQCLTMTTKVGENRRAVCLSKLKLNRANNKMRFSRMDRLRSLSLSSLTYVRQKNHDESGYKDLLDYTSMFFDTNAPS